MMVYLGIRPQVLRGQDAQISAFSLNADVQSGGAACCWNRFVPVFIPSVHGAVTWVQLASCRGDVPAGQSWTVAARTKPRQCSCCLCRCQTCTVQVRAVWVWRWHCVCVCSHGSSPSEHSCSLGSPGTAVLPAGLKILVICERGR